MFDEAAILETLMAMGHVAEFSTVPFMQAGGLISIMSIMKTHMGMNYTRNPPPDCTFH